MKQAKCCRRCGRHFEKSSQYHKTLVGPICKDHELCDTRKHLIELRKKLEEREYADTH